MSGRRHMLAALCAALPALAQAPRVLAVDVGGVIHPVVVDSVQSAVEQAGRERAELILLRLNTPGGFTDATRELIGVITGSPVPVAAFVAPTGGRAASAGFFLLQAADVAAMAPGTNTGAAHPVMLVGQPDAVMMKKIENDLAASIRSVVERRGRNVELAEKAVSESRSFTAAEAIAEKLIDVVAADEADLLHQLDGRTVRRFDGRSVTLRLSGAAVATYEPTLRQKVRASTADPNIALALVVLGLLGLYIEFVTPGVIAPGVLGALALIWGLSSLSVLPVTWTGVGLLLLAVTLFVLEIKVTSHGVLAAGGVAAMVLGALLLVDTPYPELRIRLSTALALALPFGAVAAALVTMVVRARRYAVQTGTAAMIGKHGIACTALEPTGRVLVHGELWNAVSASPVPENARVRILAVHGLELTVEAVEPAHAAQLGR